MRSEEFALKMKNLPDSPGCYLMKCEGRIIYVGKAVNLKTACASIFSPAKTTPPRCRPWWSMWTILISVSYTHLDVYKRQRSKRV